ncbi:Uncharacterised protein [Mycobacteroides abscessus subsp. abscessus]|nr:Uncharacterised protein [Mycobacteroides abscessus subsp. abscessus]
MIWLRVGGRRVLGISCLPGCDSSRESGCPGWDWFTGSRPKQPAPQGGSITEDSDAENDDDGCR